MHCTVSALVVVKPCHTRMGLFCSVVHETKQRYDFERQIVNNVTLVNVEYLKRKNRCRKICLLLQKNKVCDLLEIVGFMFQPLHFFCLQFITSETGSAGFILNDSVTHIHSSYLTNRTETTFSEKKRLQK